MSEIDSSEYYRTLKNRPVKTTELYRDDTIKPPFDISPVLAVKLKDDGQPNFLAQISKEHGRSTIDTRTHNTLIWMDVNGIPFGAVDYKGNLADDLVVQDDSISFKRVKGLKTHESCKRIMKTSQFIREHGLPTEAIAKISRITELPGKDGEMISVIDWKKEQIDLRVKEIASLSREIKKIKQNTRERQNLFEDKVDAEIDLKKVDRFLKKSDFIILERHTQVATRLRDLIGVKDKEDFIRLTQKDLSWLERMIKTTKEKPGSYDWHFDIDHQFDPTNEDDLRWYLTDWFPKQMGRYLASFHKLGLRHGFAHSQNWSLFGNLYDLDSVVGAMKDDLKPTEGNFRADVSTSMDALLDIVVEKNLFKDHTLSLRNNTYVSKLCEGSVDKMKVGFMESYLKTRFGDNIDQEKADELVNQYYPNQQYVGNMKKTGPRFDQSLKKIVEEKITASHPQ